MSPSRTGPPTTVADVLSALLTEPGRPRITWYGPGDERVELSGAVLGNWVNKTVNLLVEEMDAGPGTGVRIDLPPHWRTLVWVLATWRTGACAVVTDAIAPAAPVDVVVTDAPERHPGAPDLVAVALPALARTFGAPLPRGALDAAASVMTYGDALGAVPPTDDDAPALLDDAARLTHAELLPAAGRVLASPDGQEPVHPARVALPAAAPLSTVLLRSLGVLACGGSVVLVAPAVAAEPARLERVLTSEQVDIHLA